jgi:hypothetical protein
MRRLEFLCEIILELGVAVDERKALLAQAALENAIKRKSYGPHAGGNEVDGSTSGTLL